jgi:ABC-type glutathione transport system ATPase component
MNEQTTPAAGGEEAQIARNCGETAIPEASVPVIRVRELVKSYASGAETLRILRGVSFDCERGGAAAVSG